MTFITFHHMHIGGVVGLIIQVTCTCMLSTRQQSNWVEEPDNVTIEYHIIQSRGWQYMYTQTWCACAGRRGPRMKSILIMMCCGTVPPMPPFSLATILHCTHHPSFLHTPIEVRGGILMEGPVWRAGFAGITCLVDPKHSLMYTCGLCFVCCMQLFMYMTSI